jgi:hypothetical protein
MAIDGSTSAFANTVPDGTTPSHPVTNGVRPLARISLVAGGAVVAHMLIASGPSPSAM